MERFSHLCYPHRVTRPWHFSPSLDYLADLHVELGPGGAPKTPPDLPRSRWLRSVRKNDTMFDVMIRPIYIT